MNKQFIVVAEDDADDRFLMQTALSETGYEDTLKFVDNGVELIQFLEGLNGKSGEWVYPKLILLDLNMPKMDGREVLKIIKEDEVLRKIPVVVFSTTKNQLEVNRCYDLGANTYIVKPVNYDTFVETMKELLIYWFQIATLIES
ncbi:MAG: response regulator [Ferruginibacter sp.]